MWTFEDVARKGVGGKDETPDQIGRTHVVYLYETTKPPKVKLVQSVEKSSLKFAEVAAHAAMEIPELLSR